MFKRFFKAAVVSLIIASLLCIPAYAETCVITGNGVNFREGPGTGYNVIECLPKGTVVTYNGAYDSAWYSVSYNGRTGFVSSGYVSLGSSGDIVNPSTSGSSGSTSAGSSASNGVIIIGQGYGSYPSSDAGAGDGSSTVTPVPVNTPSPTPTPRPVSTPTPATGGTIIIGGTQPSVSTPVPSSGSSGGSSSSTTSSGSTAAGTGIRTGVISGDCVRFRTGPSTSYSIINSYNRGKELVILDTSGDWTRCTIDGTTGFVCSKYIQEQTVTISDPGSGTTLTVPSTSGSSSSANESSEEAQSAANTVSTEAKAGYISGNNVRFRSGPSLSSDIIGEFYFGNGVTITGTSGDWTAIAVDGKTGYVYSKYVKEGSYTVPSSTDTASSGGSTVSASGVSGQQVAAFACMFVGYPYCWGGTDPSTGFDCSGFVYYVYQQFGITLNRIAADQAQNGTAVDTANLRPGDVLCFYSSGSYIGHSGIYIGDGKFVHAASSTTGVIITDLAGNYSSRGFVARRILN